MKYIHGSALVVLLLLSWAITPRLASAAQLSLSCSITDNQVWNLTGVVDGAAPQISMYRGSTYVQRFFADSNGQAKVVAQFAAETSPQIYTLYNGPDSSAQFLTQTDCPAKTVSQPSTQSSMTPTPVASPQTAQPAQAQPATPTASTPTAAPTPITTPAQNTVDNAATPTYDMTPVSKQNKASLRVILPIALALILYMAIVSWRVFNKAGVAGWKSLVPIYNTVILFRLGGKSGWWSVGLLVPLVNVVALVILLLAYIEIAKKFGKSPIFGVLGLFIFSIIGWSILAFDNTQYTDSQTTANTSSYPPQY